MSAFPSIDEGGYSVRIKCGSDVCYFFVYSMNSVRDIIDSNLKTGFSIEISKL